MPCKIFFNHNHNNDRSGTGIVVNIVRRYRLHLTLAIIDLLPLLGVHLQLLGVFVVVLLLLWSPVGVIVTVVHWLPTVFFVASLAFLVGCGLNECLKSFLCCGFFL